MLVCVWNVLNAVTHLNFLFADHSCLNWRQINGSWLVQKFVDWLLAGTFVQFPLQLINLFYLLFYIFWIHKTLIAAIIFLSVFYLSFNAQKLVPSCHKWLLKSTRWSLLRDLTKLCFLRHVLIMRQLRLGNWLLNYFFLWLLNQRKSSSYYADGVVQIFLTLV